MAQPNNELKIVMPKSKFDTIFCPPVNSSGDIYHIATYLILCRVLELNVPQTVLYCDTDETRQQALRGKNFLKGLGFTNVRVFRFESKCYQANSRLSKSAKAVRSISEKSVDQKTTTSIISFLVTKHGPFIQNEIRNYIQNYSYKPNSNFAHEWAHSQKLRAIKELELHNNKFLLVNLRASSKANKEQDFTIQQLATISKFLAKHKIKMVLIDVGGNLGQIFANKQHETYTQAMAIPAFPNIANLENKYAKFPHLFLLQQFSSLPTFLGVIGNTSGTLDIAAFMGIKTLCVHRFKTVSTRNVLVPYQDLRILLQAPLMSIFDYTLGLAAFEKFLFEWLSTQHHLLYDSQAQAANVHLESGRFNLAHCERSCFAKDVAHKTANTAFLAQYNQVKCNQMLSLALGRRGDNRNPTLFKAESYGSPVKDDQNLLNSPQKISLRRSKSK